MYKFIIVLYIEEVNLRRFCNYALCRPIPSLCQLLREYSALNTGLATRVSELIPAPSLRLPKFQVPMTPGWGEAVVKGRSAQIYHAVVGT